MNTMVTSNQNNSDKNWMDIVPTRLMLNYSTSVLNDTDESQVTESWKTQI